MRHASEVKQDRPWTRVLGPWEGLAKEAACGEEAKEKTGPNGFFNAPASRAPRKSKTSCRRMLPARGNNRSQGKELGTVLGTPALIGMP